MLAAVLGLGQLPGRLGHFWAERDIHDTLCMVSLAEAHTWPTLLRHDSSDQAMLQ